MCLLKHDVESQECGNEAQKKSLSDAMQLFIITRGKLCLDLGGILTQRQLTIIFSFTGHIKHFELLVLLD